MAIKPKNSQSLTRTQTASWQYDSADYAEGMDNNNHPSYKKLTQYQGNQHGGAAEGNFGRAGANLTGNTGKTANQGKKQPPASKVPDFGAAGRKAYAGTLNAGSQARTPGGTRPWSPAPAEECNYDGDYNRINFGRGPTKGNQQ